MNTVAKFLPYNLSLESGFEELQIAVKHDFSFAIIFMLLPFIVRFVIIFRKPCIDR